MRELPDETVDAILVLRYGYAQDWPGRRDAIQRDYVAASHPALGPDRLVVVGEIVQEIALWLWTSAPVEKAWQREEIADAVRARFGS